MSILIWAVIRLINRMVLTLFWFALGEYLIKRFGINHKIGQLYASCKNAVKIPALAKR